MYSDVRVELESDDRFQWLREYIIPTIGRIAACAVGIGVGYLIGNM